MTSPPWPATSTCGPATARRRAARVGLLLVAGAIALVAAAALVREVMPAPAPQWPLALRYELQIGEERTRTGDFLARSWDDLVLVEHRPRWESLQISRREQGLLRSGHLSASGPGEPFALLDQARDAVTMPIRLYDDRFDLPRPLAPEIRDLSGEVQVVDLQPDDEARRDRLAEQLALDPRALVVQRAVRSACPARTVADCADDGRLDEVLRIELAESAVPVLVEERGPRRDVTLVAIALHDGPDVDTALLDDL